MKLTKNYAKAKSHSEAELLTNTSKKQVFLCQWHHMINCNENEIGNDKLDHIDKTYIDQDEIWCVSVRQCL